MKFNSKNSIEYLGNNLFMLSHKADRFETCKYYVCKTILKLNERRACDYAKKLNVVMKFMKYIFGEE